jgi:hypothetical protein
MQIHGRLRSSPACAVQNGNVFAALLGRPQKRKTFLEAFEPPTVLFLRESRLGIIPPAIVARAPAKLEGAA